MCCICIQELVLVHIQHNSYAGLPHGTDPGSIAGLRILPRTGPVLARATFGRPDVGPKRHACNNNGPYCLLSAKIHTMVLI